MLIPWQTINRIISKVNSISAISSQRLFREKHIKKNIHISMSPSCVSELALTLINSLGEGVLRNWLFYFVTWRTFLSFLYIFFISITCIRKQRTKYFFTHFFKFPLLKHCRDDIKKALCLISDSSLLIKNLTILYIHWSLWIYLKRFMTIQLIHV